MDFIYKLVMVDILMSKKIWEEKTLDIVAYIIFSTCGIDIT